MIGPEGSAGALDQHLHDLRRRHGAELLGEIVGGDDVHGLADEEIPGLGLRQDLGEQIAHLVHLGEPAEHGDELPVLALGDLEIDDVVVEKVLPVPGRDRLQLGAGGVHQDGLQGADLGGDFDGHVLKVPAACDSV